MVVSFFNCSHCTASCLRQTQSNQPTTWQANHNNKTKFKMSLSFYKGFSAFTMVGVVVSATSILVFPKFGLKSMGLPTDLDLATRLSLSSSLYAWFIAKKLAYGCGPTTHRSYFRLGILPVTLWFLSAYQSGDASAYGLPLIMIPMYLYFGYVFDFNVHAIATPSPYAAV